MRFVLSTLLAALALLTSLPAILAAPAQVIVIDTFPD
jgi:hypothetical protein